MFENHSLQTWVIFHAIIILLLGMDLGVFNRKAHVIKMKEAIGWSIFWIFLGLSYAGFIYFESGRGSAIEYITGYIIEKSLSVDNLFVFLVIFESMKIERIHQHRLLFWGVFGAIVLRAIMIFAGTQLLSHFHWVIYIFGAFLIFTGIKLFKGGGDEIDPQKSLLFRWAKKTLPFTTAEPKGRFTIVENGKRKFTTAFLALLMIESSDVIFALDSVPAVFGVTRDPYIVYTSNIFAILGLRSLFFVLEDLLYRFYLLKLGLAIVLIFVGTKMCIEGFVHISPQVSLAVIGAILGASVVLSLMFPKDKAHKGKSHI
jgi:tellurite resistance protein TerC